MAKFHIKLKLQGLELEVEGSRDDIPAIRQSLNQQFAGLLQPATDIAEGQLSKPITINSEDNGNGSVKRRRKNRSTPAQNSVQSESSEDSAIDWRHDTTKYGSPQQAWSASDKAIWLLYVAAKEAGASEMSGSRLAMTFKKHFRQAGQIQTGQVNRDLGRLKTARKGEPPLVSEDIQRDWEPAELDGGQFGEILARVLYHQDSGNLNRTKTLEECAAYITNDSVPHHISPRHNAIHLMRVIQTIYKFRSQRGGVHISPDVQPQSYGCSTDC